MNWRDTDTEAVLNYDSEQFAVWLKQGLQDWIKPLRLPFAFEPVHFKFDSTQEIQPQLVDMAQALPVQLREHFLEALTKTHNEALVGEDEWLLYSLEYAVNLARDQGLIP